MSAALSLIPITKPVFARYRDDDRGRLPAPACDALTFRATLDVDNDRGAAYDPAAPNQAPGREVGGSPPARRRRARRAPPADVAGRRPRAAGSPDRGPAAVIRCRPVSARRRPSPRPPRRDRASRRDTLRRWVADGRRPARAADGWTAGRGRPRADRRAAARARPLARRRSATRHGATASSPSATSRTCSRAGARSYTLEEAARRDRASSRR